MERVRPPHPVKILLVDDRRENLLSLSAMLQSPDYDLFTASSGPEALKATIRHEFAVILLDVVMPGMDGFEVATLLRQLERTRHIPVIFVTAGGTEVKQIYRGYGVGAVDYLVKPLDPEIVRAKVAVFVELYRKTVALRVQSELVREAERREREYRMAELRRASEKRYRSLAGAVPQLVWTTTPDGALDYVNARWHDYTGLDYDSSKQLGWTPIVHPDDLERCVTAWRDALRSVGEFKAECRLRGKDGTYRWFLANAVPERGVLGEVAAWVGTFTDIEEQKRTQSELDQYRKTLDAVLDGVWILDPATLRFLYVNHGALAQVDLERHELLQRRPTDVLADLDEEALRRALAPLVEGRRAALTLRAHVRARDGALRPMEISVQLIAPPGYDVRFVAVLRDLSERESAEEERGVLLERERAARLAAEAATRRAEFLSEASSLLASSLDEQVILSTVVRHALSFLCDWCVAHVIGPAGVVQTAFAHRDGTKEQLAPVLAQRRPFANLADDPFAARIGERRAEVTTGESPERLASELGCAQPAVLADLGASAWIVVPIVTRDKVLGALTFVAATPARSFGPGELAIAEDLVRRAALAIDNARLHVEARDAIRSREEFMAVAAHELRTPLTALQLKLQSLERSARRTLDPKETAKLEVAGQQVERLNKLVNELLDVSRMSTGRIDLELGEVDLSNTVREVVSRFGETIERSNARVVVDAPDPVVGRWDRLRIEQIVTNLLSNALKHAPGAAVRLSVAQEGGRARFEVRDEGGGISPEDVPRIFDRFARAGKARPFGGLGLGLYIVRQFVEAHGGSVEVTSAPGLGSTFSVVLPIAPPDRARIAA